MLPVPVIPLPRGWTEHVKSAYVHALAFGRAALAEVRAGYENSRDPRARQSAEIDRLRERLGWSEEENRILRARLEQVPPSRRPHYPAMERLAILELQAATGWSNAETGRRMQIAGTTVASWRKRIDEDGPGALVRLRVAVNAFPDAVAEMVRTARRLMPGLGRRKVAEMLARVGLHLADSTIERLAKRKPPTPSPVPDPQQSDSSERESATAEGDIVAARRVTARYVHDVWHVDLTVVPTLLGLWVPWVPFALPVGWPFTWHVAGVLDHRSRALLACGVFPHEPTAVEVCGVLDAAVAKAGRAPKHIISDQGTQFTSSEYRDWCDDNGVKPRFGALGRKGSIAVVERFWRSLKQECLRKILVPFNRERMREEVGHYLCWYHEHRPHAFLGGATPAEVLEGVVPARERPALEPRAGVPLARGDPAVPLRRRAEKLALVVSHVAGRKHLPVVELREAA